MTITTTIPSLDREIQVLISDGTPKGRARILKEFAEEEIKEVTKINDNPPQSVTVDGNRNSSLDDIKAESTIVASWQVLNEVLVYIEETLARNSPIARPQDDPDPSVAYLRGHKLFADGIEVSSARQAPAAKEYIFTNDVPYARRIELGSSSQAPDGVYQATAELARKQFGNAAKITFSYITLTSRQQPAITIRGR